MKQLFVINVLIFSIVTYAFAQKELFEKRIFQSGSYSMPYRLCVPPQMNVDTVYPLVLYFHGAGERGDDNDITLKNGVLNFVSEENRVAHPCFVLVPQCAPKYRWVEVHWALPSHIRPVEMSIPMCLTMELLEQLIDYYPIDTNRIYVTGLSMGGFATWDIITRYPDKFAAAVPLCGGGDTAFAQSITSIPIWAFHGQQDQVVLPQRSDDMVYAVNAAGGNAKLTMYETLAHNVWDKTYGNPKLIEWIFSQSKMKQNDR